MRPELCPMSLQGIWLPWKHMKTIHLHLWLSWVVDACKAHVCWWPLPGHVPSLRTLHQIYEKREGRYLRDPEVFCSRRAGTVEEKAAKSHWVYRSFIRYGISDFCRINGDSIVYHKHIYRNKYLEYRTSRGPQTVTVRLPSLKNGFNGQLVLTHVVRWLILHVGSQFHSEETTEVNSVGQ